MKLSLLILAAIFLRFVIIENNVANDFSFLSKAELASRFSVPQIWQERISEGLGQNTLAILWNWPIDFLMGMLGRIGFDYSTIQILVFIVPFVLAGFFSIQQFLKYFRMQNIGIIVGSILYLINPYALLLIDGGQLTIALAYAFVPVALVGILKSFKKGILDKLTAGILVCVIGFLDIRFVYLLAILVGLLLPLEVALRKKSLLTLFKEIILASIVIIIIFVSVNFYWILPILFYGLPSLPNGYGNSSQVFFLSFNTWKNALFLHPYTWPDNVFGKINQIQNIFILLPFLLMLGWLFTKNKAEKLIFLLVLVVGVILVGGSNPPFSNIYIFLFQNIPGFSLFRDSTKFFIFINISYAFFVASLFNYTSVRFNNDKKYISYMQISFLIYLLFLIRPVWLGNMTGTFSRPSFENENNEVIKRFASNEDFGRILNLPSQPPLGYSSVDHPTIDGLRLMSKRPFASSVVGNYETLNFIREGKLMGQLFDIAGIKYIAYPFPDSRRQSLKPDNIEYYYQFLGQMGRLPWLKVIYGYPSALLTTNSHINRLFVTNNTFLIVGSDRIYDDLALLDNFKLPQNGLIFAEEKPNILTNISDFPNLKIIAYDKNYLDVMFAFVPDDNFIFPAVQLHTDPIERGWWKRETTDFLWIRNFLQEKYSLDYQDFDFGGGLAISEGDNRLLVRSSKIHTGDLLFARVLNSSKGGMLQFFQNKFASPIIATNGECLTKRVIKLTGYEKIPDKYFTYDCADLFWVALGKPKEDGYIEIDAKGDINVINALVSIPQRELNNISNKILEDSVLYWDRLGNSEKNAMFSTKPVETKLTYTRISSTHYKVKIEDINRPVTLAFSEKFDKFWKLEGKSPYPIYSLINGYYLDNDGEYDLYYEPQKYVMTGMFGSAVAILTLFLIYFFTIKRKV